MKTKVWDQREAGGGITGRDARRGCGGETSLEEREEHGAG